MSNVGKHIFAIPGRPIFFLVFFLSLQMNKCLEMVNDRHFWNPGVFSNAMIPRCRPNSRVFFFHRRIYSAPASLDRSPSVVNWDFYPSSILLDVHVSWLGVAATHTLHKIKHSTTRFFIPTCVPQRTKPKKKKNPQLYAATGRFSTFGRKKIILKKNMIPWDIPLDHSTTMIGQETARSHIDKPPNGI